MSTSLWAYKAVIWKGASEKSPFPPLWSGGKRKPLHPLAGRRLRIVRFLKFEIPFAAKWMENGPSVLLGCDGFGKAGTFAGMLHLWPKRTGCLSTHIIHISTNTPSAVETPISTIQKILIPLQFPKAVQLFLNVNVFLSEATAHWKAPLCYIKPHNDQLVDVQFLDCCII